MIYNIPHLNEETLGPRFDTFLKAHRDKYAKVHNDIKVFFRDTEWCTNQGMAFKVLRQYFRDEMTLKRTI